MQTIPDKYRIILAGIGLAALLWICESALHVVFFQDGDFVQQLFSPDPHELWMRLLTLVLILIFSIYAQNIINRRRRAEEALIDAHAELDQIFQTAADGMRVVDTDYNMLRVNETLLNMAGISEDEALGMKCYEAFPGSRCHTDGCPLTRILGGEECIDCEVEKERRDGSRVPCIVTATPFRNPDGEVIGIVEDFKDITDRKQAEAALYEEREQLAVTLRSIGDGVIVTDTDGNVTLLNKVAEDLTGWSEHEASGRPLSEVFHIINEKTREVCENPIEKVLETGLVFGLANDTALIARDGTERSIADSGAPIRDKDNKTIGVVLVFRDVTEKKRAEEALSESEQHLSDIIEHLPDATVVIDNERQVIAWNKAIEEMTGVKKEAMIGKGDFAYSTPFYGENIPMLIDSIFSGGDTIDSRYTSVRSEGDTIIAEVFLTSMHGREGVYIWCTASPIYDTEGNVIGAIESIRDITEWREVEEVLRESEERYRNVVEDQTEFVCRFLPNGTHVFVNEAYCRYFGKKREEMVGQKFIPDIPPEDEVRVKNFFRSLTPDHPVASIRHRIIMPGGEVRWQNWNDRAIFDENDEIIEYQSVGRDITDIIRAKSALEVANKKLHLLSGITRHDILNQVTALAGYTDLLSDVLPDDVEMRKYVENIIKLTATIEEETRFTADYEELGMQPSRWQRVADVAGRAASGTSVSVSTATGTLEIFTDPMLEKVFFNLFDNAVRHGEHVTEISVTCREEDGKMVIAVEDDGVGVPAGMKERIFKRGVGSNTGYGLFLTREILGITGMSIRETGEEGKSACFEITVPSGVWRGGLKSVGM